MIFKTMKKKDVLKALEGQENVLKGAVEENEQFFKRLRCPHCKGEVLPVVNARQPFVEGSLLPNYLGKCKVCSLEFEPHTGIIVSLPIR